MEIISNNNNSKQRAQKVERHSLGTGVPIDEHRVDNHISESGKDFLDKKRLAQFFNKPFGRLPRFLESIGKQQQHKSETLSDHSTTSDASISSDEWQLLEPDEDEENGQLDCNQNLQLNKEHLASLLTYHKSYKMPIRNRSKSIISANNNNEESISNKNYVNIDPLESGLKLAPVLVHLCTALYALVPIASLCALAALVWLAFTRYWPVTLVYFLYLLLDRQTCNRGGRRWNSVYKSKFWTYLAAYFPIRLRYSNKFKLDPSENYILNYHPHGISAFGCVTCFATNALNFSQLFPGINSRFMVHETTFCVPLMREIFSFRGDCSVNSKSIDYILEKKLRQPESKGATGNLLALVGGGLAEADLSEAEVLKIVVANRKGFVKKALIHGANLIPCIAFGENSVFTKINFAPGSFMDRFIETWYKLLKFKHPFYYGDSIMNIKGIRGSLPYKRQITVVMGDPIQVERVAEPTQEQVDQLHAHYLNQLQELYAQNCDLCTRFDRKLELV